MAELEAFYCRSIHLCMIILCCFLLMRTDAQPTNPCISVLNLEDGGNAQEGIMVFITPGAKVAQGTDLSLLCCLYSSLNGLSFPDWTFEPASNRETFNVGPRLSAPLYNGKTLLYRTMSVTATESINNTMVRCVTPQLQGAWNTIIVMGPPPPPNPVLVVQDNLIIRWDPVFSWPEYPVTGYRVTLLRSNGQKLLDQTVISTSINITLQQASLFGAFLEECEELVFSVNAINELGEGEQGSITGGLPKANGLTSYNSTVKLVILFDAELQPRAEFSLKTPSLCPYQALNYTLFIEGEINGNYQTVTMSDQLKIQDLPDKIHINTHPNLSFSLQKYYTVYVILNTSGSEGVITESTNFSTIVHFPNYCSTSVNGSTESTKTVYINSSPVLQIVYALGATCAALVICIVLALCGMCVRKGRQCVTRSKSRTQREMVENPIYAGPIYASVNDARGRLLLSEASTPSSVGTPEFPLPNSVKTLENSLLAQIYEPQNQATAEPRYSTHNSESADQCYVKMKGKVGSTTSNGVITLDTVMDEESSNPFAQVSDV